MTSWVESAGRWAARLRARRALRDCDRVAEGVVLDGTPTIQNDGVLAIGARFRLASRPVPSHIVVFTDGRVSIGDDVTIAHGAAISAHHEITIGNRTRIGPFVIVMDSDYHAMGDRGGAHAKSPVSIGRDVLIGSHVTILRGAVIGDGAEIRSGSVVSGEVPAGARAGGVPAQTLAEDGDVGPESTADLRVVMPSLVMRALGTRALPALSDGPSQIREWDSLGALKVVLAIEEAFHVSIDTTSMLRVQSIADVAELTERARRNRATTPSTRRRSVTFHSPRVRASAPVHTPDAATIARSQMTSFAEFAARQSGRVLSDAEALHAFSVADYRAFWSLFLEWSKIATEGERTPVCEGDDCETARFFPRLRLSYAEALLARTDDAPALTACNEAGETTRLTHRQLRARVLAAAAGLRACGVVEGDRVVAIAANDAEAVVACLASATIGAIWSSVSPDLGAESILSRFEQLAPTVLFHRTRYRDHGKVVDVRDRVTTVLVGVPSVKLVVCLDDGPPADDGRRIERLSLRDLEARGANASEATPFVRRPFDHPLFILFSSGTTGKPKCIVHGAGGTLLEHHKEHTLHTDLRPTDKIFFHTTCAWMMWNWLVSALATGAEIVLYEGSVSYPDGDSLWQLVARERVTVFGTSPAFLQLTATAGIVPREGHDLTALRAILSTGAVLPDTAFDWITESVAHIPLQSISGGTDILGCFLLGHPNLPTYAGELQSKSLGLDVLALGATEGDPVGELVCKNPFPSRPVGLYGDTEGERFHKTYFAQNPGYWTHGDRFEWTARGTGRVHGRSDGVMNIRGIRIGPAEIYSALADFDAIATSMAIEQRGGDEGGRLVLLVVPRPGAVLDEALATAIRDALAIRCSRAHQPAAIASVSELPLTHNGKRALRSARDAVNGDPIGNLEALKNPACIEAIRAAMTAAF